MTTSSSLLAEFAIAAFSFKEDVGLLILIFSAGLPPSSLEND